MGFRENLKEALSYSGMMVKELAATAGVKKRSIDKYLTENGSIPSAEAAVKIAQTLGVSVEYLVTGNDSLVGRAGIPNPQIRGLIQDVEELDGNHRVVVLDLIKSLKKLQDKKRS
jgi:transcriptional regulator with XRE-family HTH domain